MNLFTNDGAFVVKDAEFEVVTRGHAKLREMFEHLARDVSPRPYTHTHLVELRGRNSATGRCYVELRIAKIEVRDVGSGYFEDEYTK